MKLRTGVTTAVISLTLFAGVAAAMPSLAPSVSTPEDADKTVVIKKATKQVNVFDNETVLFKVGDKQFAIKFNGIGHKVDLNQVAPAGVLDHKVKVYVAPVPTERD